MHQSQNSECCEFISHIGKKCFHPKLPDSSFCYWHDPDIDKSKDDVSKKISMLILEGQRDFEEYQLRNCNLNRIEMPDCYMMRTDLTNTDLSRANLRNVKFWQARMEGTDFWAANFEGAEFEDIKIFNNVRLRDANFFRTIIPLHLIDSGIRDNEPEILQEIFRKLKNNYHFMGDYEGERWAFIQEKKSEKKVFAKNKQRLKFVGSLFSEIFLGHGENPIKVISFSFIVVLICSVIFFFFGIKGPHGVIEFDLNLSPKENVLVFFDCLYYSIVNFTTLGYGDFSSMHSFCKATSAIEAFFGMFALGFFITSLVKRIGRG